MIYKKLIIPNFKLNASLLDATIFVRLGEVAMLFVCKYEAYGVKHLTWDVVNEYTKTLKFSL